MTTAFYIRKYKDEATIWFRFSYKRGSMLRKSTGIKIPANAWDSKKQKVKDLRTTSAYVSKINKRLDLITTKYDKQTTGEDITDRLLEKIWQRLDEKNSIDFIEFAEKFVEWAENNPNPKTKRPYAHNTIKKYKSSINKLKEFSDAHYEINFKNLDRDFHTDLISYFEEQGLAMNSIATFLKHYKVFAKKAKDEHPVNPFILTEEFYLPSNDTMHIYCSIDEIKKIHDWKTDSDRLNNVRNWFIFGCWTGLRVSDWKRVKKIDGNRIEIKPEKTKHSSGSVVKIPVHDWIKEIIKRDGMPRSISEQRFNDYIKEVCEEAGLKEKVYASKVVNVNPDKEAPAIMRKVIDYYPKYELISSHTCRRSFATNNYLINMPTITIMAITGHSTESNFLKYIKVTPSEHADKMESIWNKHFK